MPKSSKRFVLSTSAVNSYGFRMLTEGADLEDFKKNPVLLFNHKRPEGNDKNQILPLGYWDDIQIEGDTITAVPVFDENDAFAMSIYHKVENNTLRMCSAGAEPLQSSADPSLMLPGQTLKTVVKWSLKEASICDIGSNPESLVTLYNASGKIVTLSDCTMLQQIQNPKSMSNNKKTAAQLAAEAKAKAAATKKAATAAAAAVAAIQLAAEAGADTDEDSDVELSDEEKQLLADDAAAGGTDTDKDAQIAQLQATIEELRQQIQAMNDKAEGSKAVALVNKAKNEGRIPPGQAAKWLKLAKSDFAMAKELIADLPIHKTLQEQGKNSETKESAELITLSAKSWDELHDSGLLDKVKKNLPDVYKIKFTERFGKAPKNV